MRPSLLFHCGSILITIAGLGIMLAGCGTGTGNRSIPDAFAGDYAGIMTAVPGGTVGVIRASIFPSGSVLFEVSAIGGPFNATGGIAVSDQLTAFGFLDGAQLDFIGTWTADGFGAASGVWLDRQSDDTGTWLITQAGVSVPAAEGSYSGSYVLPGFIGAVTFSVDDSGEVTGTASGFELFDTPLSGSLTRDNVLVLAGTTGIGGTGEAIFFIGDLNTSSFTVTGGTAGSSLDDGIIGSWTAVK